MERDACYSVRDAYYACLDKLEEDQKHPSNIANDACAEQRKQYEGGCRKSSIKYWDDRRKKGLPIRLPTGDELTSKR